MADKKKNPYLVKTGRDGGKKTLEKYGKSHFSKIAKLRHQKARERLSGNA